MASTDLAVIAPDLDAPTSPPILDVIDVGKAYSLNPVVSRRRKVREILRAILRRGHLDADPATTFWAVDGISLRLERGASLGIIGANGAGKTTLMKLLAGIILPDRGHVVRRGNTQAMINLSAGINGEFDAVANIRNACAIRGIERARLDAKVKEILDFAELGEHAEAPAQTYSSGMKARLGFAICAHMDPDLVIIDEALAVGDATFRNKCLRRLEELRAAGCAMVLVSHSMTQIRQFCRDAIWIDAGRIRRAGPAADVTADYMTHVEEIERARAEKVERATARAIEQARQLDANDDALAGATAVKRNVGAYGPILVDPDLVAKVEVALLHDGRPTDVLPLNAAIKVTYAFELRLPVSQLNASLVFFKQAGPMVATISSLNGDHLSHVTEPGPVRVAIDIRDLALGAGTYILVLVIHDGASYLYRSIAAEFTVQSGPVMTWDLVCNFAHDFTVDPPPGSPGEMPRARPTA